MGRERTYLLLGVMWVQSPQHSQSPGVAVEGSPSGLGQGSEWEGWRTVILDAFPERLLPVCPVGMSKTMEVTIGENQVV